MQLFRFSYPFSRRIGIISCSDMLDEVGITSCNRHGMFFSNRAKELLDFCKQNPEFHIVSYMDPNLKLNRYVPGAIMYFLADCDPDPQLVYATTMREEDLEIFELRITQTTS